MMLLGILVASIVAAALFSRYFTNKANSTVLLAIILAPALFYWLEGRVLTEFGLGRFHAKFESTLLKPTEKALEEQVGSTLVAETQVLAHLDIQYDKAPPGGACLDYLVLRPSLVPEYPDPEFNRYLVFATRTISASIACGKLVGLVVLDESGKYIGSYDSKFFAQSLSSWTFYKKERPLEQMTEVELADLAHVIESNTIFGTALRFPDERIKDGEGYFAFLNTTDTLRDAWQRFQTMHGAFLVITDSELKFKGILTRRRLSNLVLRELAALSQD